MGVGVAGTLHVSLYSACSGLTPQERENRLSGVGVTASQLPRPPAAPTPCPPGGLVATAAPGSWGFGCSAGVSPSRSTARGLAASGAYLDSFGQPSSFPACPARRSRPGVPRPDLAIGRGPAAGAPRNASCTHSLRWVNLAAPELRARGRGRVAQPSPSGGARWGGRPGSGESGRQLSRRLGGGEPRSGRRFVGAAVPARVQSRRSQVGESWSCALGSPARRTPGRWGVPL